VGSPGLRQHARLCFPGVTLSRIGRTSGWPGANKQLRVMRRPRPAVQERLVELAWIAAAGKLCSPGVTNGRIRARLRVERSQ
jgi:hypothetical protein